MPEFRPIAGLPNGWQLGYQVSPSLHLLYPELPYLKANDGHLFTPDEAARSEHGPGLFHYVNRWLELADERYGYDAQSMPDWRAVDKARFAMRCALEDQGRWDDKLLETGVGG